ncbi:sulfite exporter TauE/SafE family protein [Actinokineospora auranticolor]|uniref:Probable membrane transporter protein n=1 Tax=Actinokineospora auranticolor TaxID=155976 RepID=A0A2S6GJK2_9PSEU|nr:sulfite exporter TauE/SafE family protein [Actinokineospora auranticolor]PPK65414.1 hypothetical protein CLV40_11466 [Actinokineospora auranticolor]
MSAVVTALAAGGVVGLAMGALGGGGGVLAVPALVYLLGVPPTTAATASLMIVTLTSVTALGRHAHAGNVCWRTGLLVAAAGVPVAGGTAALSAYLPTALLNGAFALVAALGAVVMLKPPQVPEEARPGSVAVRTRVRTVRVLGAGSGLGAVTGLLGVGGGFLAVPTLVAALSMRMRVAIGTSLFVIVVNSFVALGTRLAAVPISLDWAVVGPFAGAAVLAAWDGKRLSASVSPETLRRAFGAVLALVALGMFADAIT